MSSTMKIVCLMGFLLILQQTVNSTPVNSVNPTLVMSFQGLRADKLDEFLSTNQYTSYLYENFVTGGVKADFMVPQFPASTFPNHVSMMNGKYPENHGIIGDKYYHFTEGKLQLLDPSRYEKNSRYWSRADPFWRSAWTGAKLTVGGSFWPGCVVVGKETDLFLDYDKSYKMDDRLDHIVNWIEKFKTELSLFFTDEPYATGKKYGPDSPEYAAKIKEIDRYIGDLFQKLAQANLYDKVNVVVVGDAGMSNFNRTLKFSVYGLDDDLIDFKKSSYDVVSHLRPPKESLTDELFNKLNKIKQIDVYRKEDIPERFHYQADSNIAPILVVAKEGYTLSKNTISGVKGINGYDNNLKSMRTVFMATGPNFNNNVQLGPFSSVNIYSLICYLTKSNCKAQNGGDINVIFKNALKESSPSTDISSRNELTVSTTTENGSSKSPTTGAILQFILMIGTVWNVFRK